MQVEVTGGDTRRRRRDAGRSLRLSAPGQMRDLEFVAIAGDWEFYCHISHHTMGPMGHNIPNPLGVEQAGVEEKVRALLPGYIAMGQDGVTGHGGMPGMVHGK